MTETASSPRSRYSAVAMVLHWIIAAAIVFQIILGWRAGDGPQGPQTFALFQLHKSLGITILLLSVARLAWRLANPPPPQIGAQRWERIAAEAVHWGFYVIMIGLPLTGWVMASASRTGIPTLLYGAIPWPNLPGFAGMAADTKHMWMEIGDVGHGLLVKLTYVLFALHVGAALKHQLLDRDAVLGRMAAGAKPGWREPRLWLILAALAAVVAAGYLVQPPVGGGAPKPPAAAPAPVAVETPAATPAASVEAPPAAAAETSAPETAGPAVPVKWTVDRAASSLSFATAWSGAAIEGRFKTWSADILFSPEALDASKVTVTVDLATVDSGDAQRDASLASEDWFDASNHPKAVFTATKFTALGKDRYRADGRLTLRGVSKPASLTFTLKIDGDRATASGRTSLDRTAFGVGQGDYAGTDAIPAAVAVSFEIRARRAA